RLQLYLAADGLTTQREIQQRAIRRERSPCPQTLHPRCQPERSLRYPHIHPVRAHRTMQRSVVGHCVGAGAGWNAESQVEQPVPDGSCGVVVAEAEYLDVINLAQG